MEITEADLNEDDSTPNEAVSLKKKILRLEKQKARLMAALDSLVETPEDAKLSQEAGTLLDDIREEDEEAE